MVLPIRVSGAFVPLALAVILAAAPAHAQNSPAATTPAATTPAAATPPATTGSAATGIAAQTGSDAPEARALRDVGTRMHAAMMGVRQSGDPDSDFVASMLPHHQGAIDMATIELQFGKDDETRQLAEQIIAAQQKEIAAMNAWLAKRPAPPR